ncbi:serine/threonine-protein kinase, partial [Streptomyces sp. YIM 98790]|uniref:serine/threonine-protein kinase n=1 Tax=Streptomyces sp. YIM 98790 TaxID=2689077 RepID=UPI00140738A4
MKALRPEDPARVGRYELLGRLGEGGMGSVYLARSPEGRPVAVKVVLPELAEEAPFRRRFRREVEAAQRVGGRWTARVLDGDTDAEMPWVATEYVAGPSLHELVAGEGGGPLPPGSLPALAHALSRALADIHAAGLIHRDLKPSNILVTPDGPRVIDFGIARAVEAVTVTLTSTGAVIGSPGFMSPEQCRGETLTPASDIFSLGSVLAFAATGRNPFGSSGTGVHTLMLRIVQGEKDLGGVPQPARRIIEACLTQAPAGRPTPAALREMTAEGDIWGDDDAPPARRPDWLPAALTARLAAQAARPAGLDTAPVPPAGLTTAPVPPAGGVCPPTA